MGTHPIFESDFDCLTVLEIGCRMDREDDEFIEDSRFQNSRLNRNPRSTVDFSKEISCQLYGFGDDKNPYQETVALVEELVTDYITEKTTKAALEIGKPNKITLEDITYVIRKDKRKAIRAKELIYLNEEIKKARKGIDDTIAEVPK